MQISLKQSELVAAVQQFIAKQGINLVGKDVEVKFSATRGDAGVMATIDIEDSDMPGLMPNVRPSLAVIASTSLAPTAIAPIVTSANETSPPFDADQQGEVIAAGDEPANKKSLFS